MAWINGWLPLGLYFGGLLSFPFFGPVLTVWAGEINAVYQLALFFSFGHAAGLAAGGYYYLRRADSLKVRLAGAAAVLAAAASTLGPSFLHPQSMAGILGGSLFMLCGLASGWPVALYGRWLSSPATAGRRGLLMGGSICLANLFMFAISQGLQTGLFGPGAAASACALMFALGGAGILVLPSGTGVLPARLYPHGLKASLPPLRLVIIGCLVYFTGGLYYQTVLPSSTSFSSAYLLLAPYLVGVAFWGPWSDRRGRGNLVLCSLLMLGGGFSLWAASVQLNWLGSVAHLFIAAGLLCMDLFYWTSLADSAPPGSGSLTLGWGLAGSILAITFPVLLTSLLPENLVLLRNISGSLGMIFILLSLFMIRERNLDFSVQTAAEAKSGDAPAGNAMDGDTKEMPGQLSGLSPTNPGSLLEQSFLAYNLTSREQEIATLLLHDSSSREIIEKLCITQNTLKYHIKNLLRKTETNNRQELRDKLFPPLEQ